MEPTGPHASELQALAVPHREGPQDPRLRESQGHTLEWRRVHLSGTHELKACGTLPS